MLPRLGVPFSPAIGVPNAYRKAANRHFDEAFPKNSNAVYAPKLPVESAGARPKTKAFQIFIPESPLTIKLVPQLRLRQWTTLDEESQKTYLYPSSK
jgi:hypothetical protein